MDALRRTLLAQFDMSWRLTTYHLETLTTEECLWRPAAVGLHVQRQADGRWRADWPTHEGYELGPSSIAWLTWHLGFWWSMALDHTFGDASLTREDIEWPGTAEGVRQGLETLHERWRARLASLEDAALLDEARVRWPFTHRPLAELVAWANTELTKSAAEIGYVRFLYAARTSTPG